MRVVIFFAAVLGFFALRLFGEKVWIISSVVVLSLFGALVMYNRLAGAWRCAACKAITWKRTGHPNGVGRAPFCRKCGRPRPFGTEPVELRVKEPYRIGAEEVAAIVEALNRAGVAAALPMGTIGEVSLRGPVQPGSVVAQAHPTWTNDAVTRARALPPYPKRRGDDVVPPAILGVNVDAVARLSGGMGSHFGYEGLYVSILLSMPEGTVWDARAAEAY